MRLPKWPPKLGVELRPALETRQPTKLGHKRVAAFGIELGWKKIVAFIEVGYPVGSKINWLTNEPNE